MIIGYWVIFFCTKCRSFLTAQGYPLGCWEMQQNPIRGESEAGELAAIKETRGEPIDIGGTASEILLLCNSIQLCHWKPLNLADMFGLFFRPIFQGISPENMVLCPIFQAYVREYLTKYGQKYGPFTYLHFRILKFPLIEGRIRRAELATLAPWEIGLFCRMLCGYTGRCWEIEPARATQHGSPKIYEWMSWD